MPINTRDITMSVPIICPDCSKKHAETRVTRPATTAEYPVSFERRCWSCDRIHNAERHEFNSDCFSNTRGM